MILQDLTLILRASYNTRYFILPIKIVLLYIVEYLQSPSSRVRLFPVFPPRHCRGKGADLLSWEVSPPPRSTGQIGK